MSVHAEIKALALACLHPALASRLFTEIPDAEDFRDPGCRAIYGAMRTLWLRRAPVATRAIGTELENRGEWGRAEVATALGEVLAEMEVEEPGPPGIDYYVQEIQKYAAARKVESIRAHVVECVGNPEMYGPDAMRRILRAAGEDLDRIAPNPEANRPLAKAPSLSVELASFRREPAPDEQAIGSTPLPKEWGLIRAVYGGASRRLLEEAHTLGPRVPGRDRTLGALYDAQEEGRLPRGLHIFAGHTGGGKTALAIGIARAALREGHPVVYVSLELDRPEIAARMIALESAVLSGRGIPWGKLGARRPLHVDATKRAELERLKNEAIDQLEEPLARLYVWAPDPGPEDLAPTVQALRRMVLGAWEEHERRTPVVIFDYLQAPGIYAQSEEDERRLALRERLGKIAMQLRHISKASEGMGPGWVGCPVVVLSTTARSNVKAIPKKKGEEMYNPLAGMDGRDPDLLRFANLEDLKALPKEAGEIEATAVTMWALSLGRPVDTGPRKLTLCLAKRREGAPGQWVPLNFDGATGKITDAPERYAAAAAAKEGATAKPVAAASSVRAILDKAG